MFTAQQLIQQYALRPHPEGGWYKETYRSNEYIAGTALPERFTGARVFSTAIYFLLEQGNFSAFHRIKADECWHFYAGDPLLIYVLLPDGGLDIIKLHSGVDEAGLFQYVVPANSWFASRPVPEAGFCFVGCTVAPGFDFEDFELAEAGTFSLIYPQHKNIITGLCR